MGTELLAHGNNISIFLWPFSGIPKSIHHNSNWIFHYKKLKLLSRKA